MRILILIFALALAIAFTGPAFAGDVTAGDRGRLPEGLAACGMLRPARAQRKGL